MTKAPLLIDPCDLILPWSGDALPIGLVDLDAAPDDGGAIVLPPFPLMGIGNPAHPLVGRMDMVLEPPFALDGVLDAVHAQREAVAVLVQLLRLIEGMEIQTALIAESLAYGLLQGSDAHARWMAAQAMILPLPSGRLDVTRSEARLDIRIDRTAAHNAIDRAMRDDLRAAFELAALDPEIAQVVLSGAGRVFSVGADLAEFGTTRDPATAHAIRMQTLPAHAIANCREKLEVHVQGACVGSGLEMAAFARRITAHAKAWFQLPEIAMGVIAGAGGCVSVSRRIGRQRAALMMVSGKRINAHTALGWGLIDAIVDD